MILHDEARVRLLDGPRRREATGAECLHAATVRRGVSAGHELATKRLRPQAIAPLSTPVHLTQERFGRIPRVYVECTDDRALSIDMQRDMIAKSPPVDVRSVPASHSPMLSMPDKLADALADL